VTDLLAAIFAAFNYEKQIPLQVLIVAEEWKQIPQKLAARLKFVYYPQYIRPFSPTTDGQWRTLAGLNLYTKKLRDERISSWGSLVLPLEDQFFQWFCNKLSLNFLMHCLGFEWNISFTKCTYFSTAWWLFVIWKVIITVKRTLVLHPCTRIREE